MRRRSLRLGLFAVEQQGEPLCVIQFAGLGVITQFVERAGHAEQLELLELVEGGVLKLDVSSMEVSGATDVAVLDCRPVRGPLG